jgi:dephospho-CoA kinase
MKMVVLTGGVATGKSLVGRLLPDVLPEKVSFCSADQAVEEAYRDKNVLHALSALFGSEVLLSADGADSCQVNRSWLRETVLPHEELRKKLERVVHPWVLAWLKAKRTAAGENLLVAEVPLHYEIGEAVLADLIIVVASSRAMQVRRMMEHRGLDERSCSAFLDAQWPIEAKAERADVVIWNDGGMDALNSQMLMLATQLNQA